MLKFYESPSTLIQEQDQFEEDIRDFATGKVNPVKFKAIRVAHGVYEQRQNHTYMIRIRCAAGGITPTQLKKVAELGELYGGGEVHFTTRQEVQIHEVTIENIMKVIRGLNEVGLSSRGGGGNTIRNILTSIDSGISDKEAFDVEPYAIALTTRLIAEPDSWNLPRKFKIAMSNSLEDTSYTQATCLGYVATIKDGQKGFQIYCAGGMGAKPMVGHLLLDFIPENKAYHVARALKTMFDKHGNRRSKHSNRIKFLWKKLDREEFVRLFEEEYNKIKDDASLDLKLEPIPNQANDPGIPVETVTGEAYELWVKRYVEPQKQAGLSTVRLPLHLGDLYYNDANTLCDFLNQFSENTIRCERGQNIQLRNIPTKYLGNLYNLIMNLDVTLSKLPRLLSNMINCTGAQTCKLGICLPRGLSTAIRDYLIQTDLDLDAISDFRINMSGCPNTCGMHHIADLGFFGKIGRQSGNIYPAYNVLAGAKVGVAGKTEYAQRVGDIPSHQVPNFVYHFLKDYISKKPSYTSYGEYLEAEGKTLIAALCEERKEVPDMDVDATFYKDFGAKKALALDDMGTAECSAGMFDMIDVDKKIILDLQTVLETAQGQDAEDVLYRILFHSARMLLVTRGLDSKTDAQTFEHFGKHFVETELVSKTYADVVTLGKLEVKSELPKHKDTILKLSNEVIDLYKNMDDSLRFKTAEKETKEVSTSQLEKDYRGVACPMNFVKTKLVLETMQSGQELKILLDDGEPIQNVPNSVRNEGHTILEQVQSEDAGHWTVVIKKK